MFLPSSSSLVANPVLSSSASSAGEPSGFMRRKQAAAYSTEKYCFGAARTLAKLAVIGGGPAFHKAGRVVLYTKPAIDEWALAKISAARKSTSDI